MKNFVRNMKEAITENLVHLLFITESRAVREAYVSFIDELLAR